MQVLGNEFYNVLLTPKTLQLKKMFYINNITLFIKKKGQNHLFFPK